MGGGDEWCEQLQQVTSRRVCVAASLVANSADELNVGGKERGSLRVTHRVTAHLEQLDHLRFAALQRKYAHFRKG